MSKRKSEYKPLLFTTTLRNPERMKGLLFILFKYNNKKLTNNLCKKIVGDLMKYGLYKPTKYTKIISNKWGKKKTSPVGREILTNKEVDYLLLNNPQNHKEAGFEKGWPSRFATLYDFAKELGFVYYTIDEKIKFSKLGIKLTEAIEIRTEENTVLYEERSPELEQQVFMHAMAKSQRNNPFVRVLNENIPLILLLKVIKKLNNDKSFNGAGIGRHELPLVIFWKDNDSEKLYKEIKRLRKRHGYNPSSEVIVDLCISKIMGGVYKKFKSKSIIREYPDEFIRKMRLTGLVTLRGAGRFVDINSNEKEKINYILKNYSKYKKYKTEKAYFNYMSKIDNNLIKIKSKTISVKKTNAKLDEWVKVFSWTEISKEMNNLHKSAMTKNDILKLLPGPARMEFLTALAIKSNFPKIVVIPNYPCDDEGLPSSTAPGIGDLGDIECFENTKGILVEVTLSEGRSQTVMEVWPIARHLERFIEKEENSMCHFIAPSIYKDSIRQIDYLKKTEGMNIYPKTISEFIQFCEKNNELYV